jgi:hypothetical protein
MNSTRSLVDGVLTNIGNGRTQFKKVLYKLNDSTYLVGGDTLSVSAAGSNSWSLMGNSGTSPSSNFFGTTDNNSVVFRTNNNEVGRLYSNGDVAFGINTTDSNNVFFNRAGGSLFAGKNLTASATTIKRHQFLLGNNIKNNSTTSYSALAHGYNIEIRGSASNSNTYLGVNIDDSSATGAGLFSGSSLVIRGDASQSLIQGTNVTVTGDTKNSTTSGRNLTNNAPMSAVFGENHTNNNRHALIAGPGSVTTATNKLLFVVGKGSSTNAITTNTAGRTQINTIMTTQTESDITPKAALEIVSNNSGILIPKLTTTQRDAIDGADLHNGLLLYNTDVNKFQYLDNNNIWNNLVANKSVKITSDQSSTSTSTGDVTGLSFSVTSGTYYKFKFVVVFRSAATSTGIKLGINAPSSTVFSATAKIPSAADGTGGSFHGWITSSGDIVTSSGVEATATDYVAIIEGMILPSASGTVQLIFASGVGSSQITIRNGSFATIETY